MKYYESFKKGDRVKVISGPYRGEIGTIVEVGWDEYRILLDKGVYIDVGPAFPETSIVKLHNKRSVKVRKYVKKVKEKKSSKKKSTSTIKLPKRRFAVIWYEPAYGWSFDTNNYKYYTREEAEKIRDEIKKQGFRAHIRET
ncbi:MAG: KOW motif-containing protein [Candidatus Heimdallarchaeaceae archaeon]